MNLKEEIQKLNTITEEILEVDNLNQKCKSAELVLGRMLVTNILMDNKIKPSVLAQHYCKDRSNFYHYRKKHLQYIENPKIYPEYITLYMQVHDEYIKRAKDLNTLCNLQRLEILDAINTSIDELITRKAELLLTLEK